MILVRIFLGFLGVHSVLKFFAHVWSANNGRSLLCASVVVALLGGVEVVNGPQRWMKPMTAAAAQNGGDASQSAVFGVRDPTHLRNVVERTVALIFI